VGTEKAKELLAAAADKFQEAGTYTPPLLALTSHTFVGDAGCRHFVSDQSGSG